MVLRYSLKTFDRKMQQTYFLVPSKKNVVLIFFIIMHAIFTSAAFAERSSSSPQPEFPLASNHNNHVIGRAADNLYIRYENHLGCNVSKSKYNTKEQITEYDNCINNGAFFIIFTL